MLVPYKEGGDIYIDLFCEKKSSMFFVHGPDYFQICVNINDNVEETIDRFMPEIERRRKEMISSRNDRFMKTYFLLDERPEKLILNT